jgi:hypothetical protein
LDATTRIATGVLMTADRSAAAAAVATMIHRKGFSATVERLDHVPCESSAMVQSVRKGSPFAATSGSPAA